MIKFKSTPPPQQIEIKFNNNQNGTCIVYYKEVTTVPSIEQAKLATSNTKIFFKISDPDAVIKIRRKRNKITVEKVIFGRVNSIIVGLIYELLAQSADINKVKKFMMEMIKKVYTKKELKALEEAGKESLKKLEERKHASL
jgi:hypothetical protein